MTGPLFMLDTDTSIFLMCGESKSSMGLSVSDAIRLHLMQVADEQCLPFDVKVPNSRTRKAMAELESGKGKKFNTVDDLMANLNEDN